MRKQLERICYRGLTICKSSNRWGILWTDRDTTWHKSLHSAKSAVYAREKYQRKTA